MGRNDGHIRPHQSKISVLQRVADSFIIAGVHYVIVKSLRPIEWSVYYEFATVAAILFYLTVAELGRHYRSWRSTGVLREITHLWGVWACTAVAMLFMAFVFKVTDYCSRVTTATWFVMAPTCLSLSRIMFKRIFRALRARGANQRTVAIIGATKVGAEVGRTILNTPDMGMKIVGYFDDRSPERLHDMPMDRGTIKGSFNDVVDAAKKGELDLIYIALPLRAESRINDLVSKLADTTASVYIVADFFIFDLLRAQWSDIQGLPVVSIFESPFYGVDGWLKRVQDIILGTIILSIIAVPMLLIAVAVKCTSKGPIFFRQRRYGLNGREIKMLKFRTMTVCEDGDTVKQATKNDARITPLGAILRKTSLDELPQFLQVITGEMSIVGPRPHAVAHNEEYRRLIHGYMLRHKVKPGITGWAQINGWRGETNTLEKMEKRVEHDLEYIRSWNLFLDLKIIFLTIFGGFISKNAY